MPARRQEISPGVVRGEFFTKLPDGRVRCEQCSRYCEVHDGQRAFCFIRQAQGGEIVMTSYGKSTGFCIDPIEKKPLNHFYPGSSVLSFGTAGCNLGCRFCQNWDISKAREVERLCDAASPDAIADAAERAGCVSVAFTYNDPVIFHEYAVDTAIACHEHGVKTVAVTSGYVSPQSQKRFYEHMDAANVDLKAFTEEFYHKLSLAHLQPVLDGLKFLKDETNVWVELTTLLIPGHNDSEDETARMCDWILKNIGPDVPLHFTAFHPDFKMTDIPRTPPEILVRARKQALTAGLHYVYTGNVHDTEGQSTYCHKCGELLIERDWYDLGQWNIKDGACARCGTKVAGHFVDEPGHWGGRRMAIAIA